MDKDQILMNQLLVNHQDIIEHLINHMYLMYH